MQFFVKFWMIQTFFRKTLSSVSCPYIKKLSCKQAQETLGTPPMFIAVAVLIQNQADYQGISPLLQY